VVYWILLHEISTVLQVMQGTLKNTWFFLDTFGINRLIDRYSSCLHSAKDILNLNMPVSSMEVSIRVLVWLMCGMTIEPSLQYEIVIMRRVNYKQCLSNE
jgi:hypothetical protein